MPTLSPIISVAIVLSALAPSVGPDLTVPLVLTEADATQIAAFGGNRTAVITPDAYRTQLAALGYADGDPIWEWCDVAFAQQGADGVPRQVIVGYVDTTAWSQLEKTITIDTAADGVWSGTINGQPFSFTASGSAADSAIATGIANAINALTSTITPVTATDTGADCAVEADGAGELFDLSITAPAGGAASIATTTALDGPTDDLDAILAERSSWYELHAAFNDPGVLYSLASPFASKGYGRRIFLPLIHDTVVASGVAGSAYDLADYLATLQNARVSVWYDPAAGQEVDAAAAGRNIMRSRAAAGSPFRTWANLRVTGLTGWTPTATQQTNMLAKSANYAVKRTDAITLTYPGKLSDGQFLDARIAADDLAYYIEEQAIAMLSAAVPPPFSASGRELLEGVIEGWIRARPQVDGEQPVTVNIPAISSLPVDDQGNRIWSGITFSCFLNEALHGVGIQGEILRQSQAA